MNLNRILLLLVLLLHSIRLHAADPLTETFQKGLFEEEANRDLAAAVKAYEDVVRQLDAQRKLAATAVFRLGECYRKLGRTNDAVAQFQRIVREYSDDETLAKLSQQNLAGLGVQDSATSRSASIAIDELGSETRMLSAKLERLKASPDRDVALILKTLFNDPKHWPIGWSADSVATIGLLAVQAEGFRSELESIGMFPKPDDDPKIVEQRQSLTANYSSALSAFQKRLAEFVSGIEKRLSVMRDVAASFSQQSAKPSPESAVLGNAEYASRSEREIELLEGQIKGLEVIPEKKLPEVVGTVFPDSGLERLRQDYQTQIQVLVAYQQDMAPTHPQVLKQQAVVDLMEKTISDKVRGILAGKKVQLAALKASSQAVGRLLNNPLVGDIAAHRGVLEREIELAQQQLKIAQTQVAAGRATAEETIKAEREVLRLQRELAALQEPNSGPVPMSTTVDGSGSARAVAAQVSWLKGLKQEDRLLAIQTQVPSDRMKELMRAMGTSKDREAKLDENDSTAVQAMFKERERLYMEIDREADAILRSLELKAEMLRAAEAGALGKAVRETAGAPDVRPLRITLSGAAGAPLILVYPKEFPAARIPAEHLTNPTVVIGTTVLAEVVARANVIGANGKTNAIAIRRTEGGEEKQWRLDPAGKEAQGFELQDGDVIEVDRKVFVF